MFAAVFEKRQRKMTQGLKSSVKPIPPFDGHKVSSPMVDRLLHRALGPKMLGVRAAVSTAVAVVLMRRASPPCDVNLTHQTPLLSIVVALCGAVTALAATTRRSAGNAIVAMTRSN
jgi:hypothetical protein